MKVRWCNRLLPVLLLALAGTLWQTPQIALAANDARIAQIKQERQRLAEVKRQLESQMGQVGGELRKLDAALIEARKESRAATAKVREIDLEIKSLDHRRADLEKLIASLKAKMLDEASAAWQRGGRTSQWLGIFTGVPVSDIPQRRYLLNIVLDSQQQDRQRYIEAVAELPEVLARLKAQRLALMPAMKEKKQAEAALGGRVADKRGMLNRLRTDVVKQKKRDRMLAREEKALLRLLDDMNKGLLAVEQQDVDQNVRKRKGALSWPLYGRVVASFHSKPTKNMPRIQGVQLKPNASVHEVKTMAAGQVRYADWFGGYGLMIIVDYGNGVLGVYAHNDALYRQLGDWVEEGETIADAGSTGWVNKVTVYFEIRDKGKAVNPKLWCRR